MTCADLLPKRQVDVGRSCIMHIAVQLWSMFIRGENGFKSIPKQPVDCQALRGRRGPLAAHRTSNNRESIDELLQNEV